MDMRGLKEFEYLIKNDPIPELDKEKLLHKILQNKGEKSKLRFRPRKIILISFLTILLFSGLVFGEELAKFTKSIFKMQINKEEDKLSLFSRDPSNYRRIITFEPGSEY